MSFTPRLDEAAIAGPEHLDADYVERYDRKARVDPTEELAQLRDRRLNPYSTLVDFGAGTGTFALAASRHCKRVVAVDISPAMVAAMQTKAAEQGVTNVEFVQAGFLSYEHTGQPVDFRVLAECPPSLARLLEGDCASTSGGHPPAGRRVAAARPRVRVRSRRGGGLPRAVARDRRRRPRGGLDTTSSSCTCGRNTVRSTGCSNQSSNGPDSRSSRSSTESSASMPRTSARRSDRSAACASARRSGRNGSPSTDRDFAKFDLPE